MTEYNLNFFEAMAALKKGETVTNDLGVGYIYKSIDGNLKASLINTENYWFYSKLDIPEIAAKWRIVEPEKCWLDQRLEIFNAITRGNCKAVVSDFVCELIKRIEDRLSVQATIKTSEARAIAVKVLQELIGES